MNNSVSWKRKSNLHLSRSTGSAKARVEAQEEIELVSLHNGFEEAKPSVEKTRALGDHQDKAIKIFYRRKNVEDW
jgi:hypothetical protein